MGKTLVLLRHGHRDTAQRELDNGLDAKGKEQAKAIRCFFEHRFGGMAFTQSLWLVSSPKLRCMETLAPVAKALALPVKIHPALDEQAAREPAGAFAARVLDFLREWRESPVQLTLACSHGDWIPQATRELLGIPQEPKKGSWLELEECDGRVNLKWYIPTFKPFYAQKK